MIDIIPSLAKLFHGIKITRITAPSQVKTNLKYSTSKDTFPTKPFKLHKLDTGPSTSASLVAADGLMMYEKMLVIRRMEKAIASLYKDKAIRGFCHMYIGQEAIAVGMDDVMRKVDTVITSYRCHGWSYLCDISIAGIICELTGRRCGSSRGKGGSMHLYGPDFYGGNGIVGAQAPLGAGLAFAHKYRSDGGVCFTMYGDGAANQGQLFEAFNISKLLNLPCVFVCENNKYGMGTKSHRSSASTDYYARGDYIPGVCVDGMDVLSVREATVFAIDYCTSGKGPLVLEMDAYRYSGHSMSDPGTSYRTRDEVQEVRRTRDPINNFKNQLLDGKLATEEILKEIDAKVRKEVAAATKESVTESEIGSEELAGDIYFNNLEPYIRGTRPDLLYKHINLAPRK